VASIIGRIGMGGGLRGWSPAWLGPDLVAGLTLAAIAIPEQMATARLAGLPPQVGLLAFVAGGLAFTVFGASRFLSSGADSTIAPIFAGGLAGFAAVGSPHYALSALALAIMVGAIVAIAGAAKMGWIGDLISAPVMTGFLAGISAHILASQGPTALGISPTGEATLDRLIGLVAGLPRANPYDGAIAIGVLAAIALLERVNRRIPGALIAVAVATLLSIALRLDEKGVAQLGALSRVTPRLGVPTLALAEWLRLGPLAFLVAAVVMVQTATVSRAFPSEGREADVDQDFIGVGAGSLLAGLAGAFPVNASPPRTAVVEESGGCSQAAGLVAVALTALLMMFGLRLLAQIPTAALAGVLLFVAARLVRVAEMAGILRQSPVEFLLVLATIAAIVVLPIQWGVATGVALSILHGVWSGARVRVRPMRRIPGTTVWWPEGGGAGPGGERLQGVQVLTYPAPLTFLVAETFARDFLAAACPGGGGVHLVILEAAGMVMIDYTAARALGRAVRECRASGCDFALARLESPAAQAALERLGLRDLIGKDHIFESVAAAIRALAPNAIPIVEPRPA
jgi:MFS superfamily sulfate permease-like transporter